MSTTKVLITIFSPSLTDVSVKTATATRKAGINTELYPDPDTKLDKQLKYASAKSIPYVIILGDEEIVNGKVTLKNMTQRSQTTLSLDEAIALLANPSTR